MHIGYTAEQEALREELRAYYAELLTDDVRAELEAEDGTGPVHRHIVRQMGSDGWLAVGWPEEYGGRGLSAVEQFIVFDESVAFGRAHTDAHHQHRRPDDHAVRHRRAEGVLPASNRRRRAHVLHRLLRAPTPVPTWPRSSPGPCLMATRT